MITPSSHVVISPRTVQQAGDVFLVRFTCGTCGQENYQGWPIAGCSLCKKDYASIAFDFSGARRELITGSRRKQKQYLTVKLIRAIVADQRGLCAYCYRPADPYHIDHIIPIAVGGTNARHNLVLACPRCNLIAGRKAFISFAKKQEYILDQRRSEI